MIRDGFVWRALRVTMLLLAVDTILAAQASHTEQAITWVDDAGAAGPRYYGLRPRDARAQEIPGRLLPGIGGVTLEPLNSAAAYPLTMDPWLEQAHLVPNNGEAFGGVAVSGDTAIVGAVSREVGPNDGRGSVYVFTRNGGTWTQHQKLTASGGTVNDGFGGHLAISGDTIVVGALASDGNRGAAYVFTRNGGTWTQQQKLTASDGAFFDLFGISVAVSGDTVVVGATANVGGVMRQGAAYVFTRSGGTWSQRQKLTAGDGGPGDDFGRSVATTGDTVIVSGLLADDRRGAAYVFTQSGGTWTQAQKLTASDGAALDFFGASVAISGNTVMIGATRANLQRGAVYVFTRNGGTWTQHQKLIAGDGAAADDFGASVAISGDTAIVGANVATIAGDERRGTAYVFTRSGGAWALAQKLAASDGAAGDFFGGTVAISGDTVFVSAVGHDVGSNRDRGTVYIFGPPSSAPPATDTTTLPSVAPPPQDDSDKPRKLTQEERQQRQRTNASNLDQYHTEGTVTAVERAPDGSLLLATIALGRGETLVVEIRCSPAGCPDVQVGDYLDVEGEQGGRDEAGHFLGEDVTITRAGRRVP
jgi:hypothetical protein